MSDDPDPYKPPKLLADIELSDDVRELMKIEKQRSFEKGIGDGNFALFCLGMVAGFLLVALMVICKQHEPGFQRLLHTFLSWE